jgi:Fe-S-cluster containining protein
LYGNTLAVSPEDLVRWRAEGRADLLERVSPEGELWIDPASSERMDRCPFLEKRDPHHSTCGIHETKPQICREYPTPVHAFRCVRGIRFPGKTFTSIPR